MRLGGAAAVLAIGIAAAACASTIGPLLPSVQVLVVLDSLDDTLRVIPVDSPNVVHKVPLNLGAAFNKHALALDQQLVAIGVDHSAALFDLTSHRLCPTSNLDAGGTIASLAFDDNGILYAAVPSINGAPHIDPATCGVGTAVVRGRPVSFVGARSTLFVVTGDSAQFSWLSTAGADQSNGSGPLAIADSIALSFPGHAKAAVLASDGFIYVINSGSGLPNARLSQVNPVSRTELSVIAGFGTLPQYIATDGADRIFVASAADGLMVYNIRTNHVDRDANSSIPLHGTPRGMATDDVGRVYALIAGGCTSNGALGSISPFGSDLVNQRPITVGRCPVAIGVTDIPATLYHFDN